MKKITTLITNSILFLLVCCNTKAQNIFPSTGRAGVYTTSPASSLQVKGGARIGTLANYLNVDSATGNLSFVGTSAYRVAGNKYAFQYSGNTNYGLFFNSTSSLYEFRNGSAVPVFSVNANNGNSVFNGTLKVGAYTLPATDGANGQLLKTNGAGALTWSNDNTSGAGSGWLLTGNAGTNPSTNFIGTTDAQPLIFKVNNIKAGYLDYDASKANTGFGYKTLSSNTGIKNTAIGYSALFSNTIGYQNTATGDSALYANTTGFNNSAYGSFSMYANTSGQGNTAIGYSALFYNTTGNSNTANGNGALYYNTADNNTAIGYASLFANTTGVNNSSQGTYSLYSNTTGQQNTANGYAALYSCIDGSYNSANGSAALNSNVSGSWNTANGAYAMYLNTNSYYNTATGGNALYSNIQGTNNTANGYNALYKNTASNNTAIGSAALYGNTTGSQNTATGSDALHFNTTGYDNTAYGVDVLLSNTIGTENTSTGNYSLQTNTSGSENTATGNAVLTNNTTGSLNVAEGYAAMYNNTTGGVNTAVGVFALSNNQTGTNNTGIGAGAGPTSANLNYTTTIGTDASATASNQARIGSVGLSSDPTSIGGKVGWSTLSDGRAKKNIKENVPGLSFINKLKPITYNINNDAINKIVQRPAIKSKDRKEVKLSTQNTLAIKENTAIIYTGFVAQDVEKAAKSLNYDFSGVDAAKNDKDLYGLRYADFVVPLVKAVQELSAKNDDLQRQLDELKAIVLSGNLNNSSAVQNSTSITLNNPVLEQNIPNPFKNTTTINYSLPQKFTSAQIIITDKTGKTLKSLNISGSGKGSLSVDAATLTAGAYQYSLIVDGKLIGTKQMVLAR